MTTCIVIIDLHCDPTIPSGAGDLAGGNTYSRNLLFGLMNTKYKNIFITRKKYSYLDEYIKLSNNSDFYRIDLGDFGPIDKDELQKYHNISLFNIKKILSNYKNYKFIFHSSYWQSGLLALELSLEFNTFYVHTILSNAKKKKMLGAGADNVPERIEAEEKVFSNAKYLICSSISEMKDMTELYEIENTKLILTGLPIHKSYSFPAYNASGDISVNTMLNSGKEPQYLTYPQPIVSNDNYLWWNQKSYVYIGRIHENKGIRQIIKAWIALAEKIADIPPLWIIGGAPPVIEEFRKNIKNDIPLLNKYELNHKIIWWGTLQPEGISTLLLKALVVITHSKYEAGGLVTIEAMRQGVPVIGTPNGYVNDYVKNWYNGFVVKFNDIYDLSRKLLFFHNQPYLTSFLGQNARETSTKLIRSWNFFDLHLFAYGIKEKKDFESYSYIPYYTDYYSINHNMMSIYPYISNLPSIEKLKKIICSNLHIDNCKIMKMDSCKYDYEKWTVETENKVYKLLYLYDKIREEEIWNPSENGEYTITKSQRVRNYMKAESIGLSSKILFHSTQQGFILLEENNTPFDIIDMLDGLQDLKMIVNCNESFRYTLYYNCNKLKSNLLKFCSESLQTKKLCNILDNLLQQIPKYRGEPYIGIEYGKDSFEILENNVVDTMPYDSIIISEMGELEAYIIYNYLKKRSEERQRVVQIIEELQWNSEFKLAVKNWCEFFRIYDMAENYIVTSNSYK